MSPVRRWWRTLKCLGVMLSVVGVLGGFVSFFVTTRYLQTAPLFADPTAGIVYAVKARGEVIYLSWGDYLIQVGLLPASFVVAMLGASLLIWSKKKLGH